MRLIGVSLIIWHRFSIYLCKDLVAVHSRLEFYTGGGRLGLFFLISFSQPGGFRFVKFFVTI